MRSAQIKMIVGLGNPGSEYANTRHNAGFMAIDELAGRSTFRCSSPVAKRGALVREATVMNQAPGASRFDQLSPEKLIVVQPQSFMNCSGGPVSKLANDFELDPEEILVIHDEIDLPLGDVRVKVGGGHAGHNGLRSIIDKLQSNAFVRIRIGVGRPSGQMPVADFVLAQIKGRAADEVHASVQTAVDAVEDLLLHGVVHARDRFNIRSS